MTEVNKVFEIPIGERPSDCISGLLEIYILKYDERQPNGDVLMPGCFDDWLHNKRGEQQ